MIYPRYTIVSPLSLARAIHIMDEDSFEDRLETTSDEMMDDSITEVAREYLPLYRISHDKCCTRLESICAILYLFPELDTLALIVQLEFESSIRVSLMIPTVIVGSEDVSEGKHDNPEKIRGSFAKRWKQRKPKTTIVPVRVGVTIAILSDVLSILTIYILPNPTIPDFVIVLRSTIVRITIPWN
jgi:hypothetical protein